MTSFAIKSRSVLLPESGQSLASLRPAILVVVDGKIHQVTTEKESKFSGEIIDVGDLVVMPGICDTHVHMNEPGRTEWEGIKTATQAAAAGGITTLVDMPLNSIPPTTHVEALKLKRSSAGKTAYVDYGFWGGVIPGNLSDLEPLISHGVLGFKAFMIDSGVSEFPMASQEVIRESLKILAKHQVPLLVHAEFESPVKVNDPSVRSYRHYLESRPSCWEVEAIQQIIRLAQETGARVHIVHLSAAEAIKEIQEAKKKGLPVSAETCPHYLTLKAEEISEGETHFKCAPPIRNEKNQNLLWDGLKNGVIDFIVSDHSPCTPQLKNLESGNFDTAWGGIAGLQFSLPVIWTEMKSRGFSLGHLSLWMSQLTTEFLMIEGKTGRIEEGCDADLVVWDPNETFTLKESQILHRHKVTPYLGKKLSGVVKMTFVRGQKVYDEGQLKGPVGLEVKRK